MTLNMRFSSDCGTFRISAFGLELEVAHADGQNEIVISKVDGCVHFDMHDIPNPSDESNQSDEAVVNEAIDDTADSVIEESMPDVADGGVVSEESNVVADSLTSEESQAELFSRLSALRKKLAAQQGKPPYIIFHDSTLRAIAKELPGDLKSLAKIDGVGRVKLKRYGGMLLEVVSEYQNGGMAG